MHSFIRLNSPNVVITSKNKWTVKGSENITIYFITSEVNNNNKLSSAFTYVTMQNITMLLTQW